jgi:hypothetical protein
MERVAENTGPESAVRPPARKPGTVPATAERPLADGAEARTQGQPQPQPAVQPAPEVAPQPQPQPELQVGRPPAPRPLAAAVEPERRYRQTIHRVDLWSVLKISVCFYICGMAVTLVALIALWAIADAAGVVHSVENFIGDLLQTKDFTFLDGEILRGALLVGAVLVVLQIVVTVIAAAFYNVFAELFGGIELTISEDESAL